MATNPSKLASCQILYATAPDESAAETIAATLLEARLAACVNILGPVVSLYRWDAKLEKTTECAFIVKTSADCASHATQAIIDNHPYDTPCVVALNIQTAGSNKNFLDWIAAETSL
ncbi:MAG: divalent-cation tolerance protein CutA [Pseudomonadota bacterium]